MEGSSRRPSSELSLTEMERGGYAPKRRRISAIEVASSSSSDTKEDPSEDPSDSGVISV